MKNNNYFLNKKVKISNCFSHISYRSINLVILSVMNKVKDKDIYFQKCFNSIHIGTCYGLNNCYDWFNYIHRRYIAG